MDILSSIYLQVSDLDREDVKLRIIPLKYECILNS